MKKEQKESAVKESLANSFDEIRDKVRMAIEAMPTFKKQVNGVDIYVYIRDISPNKVIVKYGDELFAMSYSIVDDVVVIGSPEKVVERYIKESIEITKEGKEGNVDLGFVSLKESTYDGDKGEVEVVLIEAGTNELKKRHYPDSTIREAAPNFKGLKMYINHPTKTDEREIPERRLQDWVSTITESYYDNGKAMAKVAVHDDWLRGRLKDPIFRENVGLSINTGGKLSVGKVNGKEMQIVEAITPRRKDGLVGSVDWVTEAGARGRVSRLLESRTKEDSKVIEKLLENVTIVDLKETRKDLVESIVKEAVASKDAEITKLNASLKESNDKIAKFESEGKLKIQKDAVEMQLKESKAPNAVKDRVREAFSSTIVEGDLKEAVTKKLTCELDYASKISGKGKISLSENSQSNIKESAQVDMDGAFGHKEEAKK